jgi:Putative ABC exporter
MHPALWTLMRLTNQASMRRLVRGAKSVRGALLLLFLTVVLGFWPVMIGVMLLFGKNVPEMWKHTGTTEAYLPYLLMVLFLQSALGKNSGVMMLHFQPAEVDFLFAGPFHRSELLRYKLWAKGFGLILSALLCSTTPLLFFFRSWLAMFVGLTLALAFISLAGLAAALLRLIVAEAAYTRARKTVLIAVGTLTAMALPQTILRAQSPNLSGLSIGFRSTWPGRVLLAPFDVFSHVMVADRWYPDLLGWAGAAAAIDLALLILVFKLDADYLESSASISQWIYDLQQRVRSSGGLVASPPRPRSRFRLPQFPWLGGAGPIAWRQTLLTSRKCRGMAWTTLILTTAILAWYAFSSGRFSPATISPGLVIGLFSYVTYLFCATFPVGFRGDVHHLDVLKTLPVRALALTAGELAGCVSVVSGFQLAFLVVYGTFAQTGAWLVLAAAILAPPLDWLLLATGSLVFLIYPMQTTSNASFDLNRLGRGLLSGLLLMLFQFPLLGFAAVLAAGAYVASGYSLPVLVAAALVALVVEAVPMTMLTAWAFERYDPGMDTPVS